MFEFIHTRYMEKYVDQSEQVEPYMARVIAEIDKSISDRVSVSMGLTPDQIGREQPSTLTLEKLKRDVEITIKKTADVGPSVNFYSKGGTIGTSPRLSVLSLQINSILNYKGA